MTEISHDYARSDEGKKRYIRSQIHELVEFYYRVTKQLHKVT